jgi:hypothetical protein
MHHRLTWKPMQIDLLIRRGHASPEATFSGATESQVQFFSCGEQCSFRFIHGPYIATVLPRYVSPPQGRLPLSLVHGYRSSRKQCCDECIATSAP